MTARLALAIQDRRLVTGLAGLTWLLALGPWAWALITHPDGTLGLVGFDLGIYMNATHSWLAGHGFYLDRQLLGHYVIANGDSLYPPTSLWLFVPFTVLPAILFWIIPLGVTGYVLYRARPSMLGWALIGLCLVWPLSTTQFLKGNPVIWVLAAESAGLIWGWPSAFVLLKPTVAPFVLTGRGRPLLAGLLAFAVLSLPLLPLWPQWLTAVMNADGGLLYGIRDVPLMLIPLVAYFFGSGLRFARPHRRGSDVVRPEHAGDADVDAGRGEDQR